MGGRWNQPCINELRHKGSTAGVHRALVSESRYPYRQALERLKPLSSCIIAIFTRVVGQ